MQASLVRGRQTLLHSERFLPTPFCIRNAPTARRVRNPVAHRTDQITREVSPCTAYRAKPSVVVVTSPNPWAHVGVSRNAARAVFPALPALCVAFHTSNLGNVREVSLDWHTQLVCLFVGASLISLLFTMSAVEETPVVTPEAPEGGEAVAKKKFERNKNEKPIEELYDLSKPIPKEERPDKEGHEKAVQELTDAVEALKEERRKIQERIDATFSDPQQKSEIQELRTEMQALKTQKGALIDQKKALRAQLDQAKSQTDKLIKDKKDTRSQVKFNSVEEIEAEIAKLMRQQETTSMSLNEEKKIIKEMDALRASKKHVAALKSKDGALDGVKEERKSIGQQITAKDKEIDEVSKDIDQVMTKIKALNETDSTKRDAVQGLIKERDEYKLKIGEKLKEKDALRDAYRLLNNKFYNFQRAIRAQKKIQYEEEKEARDAEKAAYLAKVEEEEAKKIPYEEEQALCEFLANFLERTYLSKPGDEAKTASENKDVVAVKDDPFAGLKPVSKKDADEEYFGKGKAKKKRTRATKNQDTSSGPFTLSVDTFEQFGLLSLNPPTSSEQVAKSVQELREKKEWYKQQPRGSVPTAAEIRKSNEKAVAKQRQSSEDGDAPQANKKAPQGAFSLSKDDFVPLGVGAAATSINSSWGQKPAASQEAS